MFLGLTLFYTLSFLLASASGRACDSIEEGDVWNYICAVQNFTQTIDFQVKRGGSFETVTSCDPQFSCQTLNTNYSSSLSQGLFQNPDTGSTVLAYRSRLTMKDVNRDEKHFRCFVDGYSVFGGCEFDIYVKPKKPTCAAPTLTSSGQHLSVKCKTDQVYPMANCTFSSDALQANSSLPVTYRKMKSPIKEDDFSVECEGRIPVTALTDGLLYQFRVTMYADVKDGKLKTSIKSDLTTPYEFMKPKKPTSIAPTLTSSEAVHHDEDDDDSHSLYLIVGLAVLGAILVIVVIVAFCLYRRKKPAARNSGVEAHDISNNGQTNSPYKNPYYPQDLSQQQPPPYHRIGQSQVQGNTSSGVYSVPYDTDYIEPVDIANVSMEVGNGVVGYRDNEKE